MIPITPEEQGEDPSTEKDTNLVEPHSAGDTDETKEDEDWWHFYLENVENSKVYIQRLLKHVSVHIARWFLTAQHKSVEGNREAFMYGLSDGLFKIQPRAHSNCLTDGPAYLRALLHFSKRMFLNHYAVSA